MASGVIKNIAVNVKDGMFFQATTYANDNVLQLGLESDALTYRVFFGQNDITVRRYDNGIETYSKKVNLS